MDALDPSALRDLAAALKHDLGKYVAWRSANLDEAAWTGPVEDSLVDALQADILRTREGPHGVRTAWDVWDELTAELSRPLAVPELQTVETAVAVLREAGPALDGGDPSALAPLRADIRRAQRTIRDALRDLHRRLLRES